MISCRREFNLDNITVLTNNKSLTGNARVLPHLVFSTVEGERLEMQLIVPWSLDNATANTRYPVIIFLQGSGWRHPDVTYELPQLCDYARHGYIVAMITHRSCDDYAAPSFLIDCKTAVRFIRKQAEIYPIDTENIGFFGTSSGGNAALLMGLTGDNPRYKTAEYAGYSDAVKSVVSCFGPTDLTSLIADSSLSGLPEKSHFVGDDPDILEKMSPLLMLGERDSQVPVLLLHGTADKLVPYQQSVELYQALHSEGIPAELVAVQDADHEGDFWSQAVHDKIIAFFDKTLRSVK